MQDWKHNLETRGHLDNFVRGLKPGEKFIFDGSELECIKKAKDLYTEMYLDEVVRWVMAQAYRYVSFSRVWFLYSTRTSAYAITTLTPSDPM